MSDTPDLLQDPRLRAARTNRIGAVSDWLSQSSRGRLTPTAVSQPGIDLEVSDRQAGTSLPLTLRVRVRHRQGRSDPQFEVPEAVLDRQRVGIVLLIYAPRAVGWAIPYVDFRRLARPYRGNYRARIEFPRELSDEWSVYRRYTSADLYLRLLDCFSEAVATTRSRPSRRPDAGPTDGSLVDQEREKRLSLWHELQHYERGSQVPASAVKERRIHVGEQGIFRDLRATAQLTDDGAGVTVGVLHTGTQYPDDLDDHGLVYHYPSTRRARSQDAREVQATRNAGRLGLPIFVITPSTQGGSVRRVRLGWVEDWNDDEGTFLIAFGSQQRGRIPQEEREKRPFELTHSRQRRSSTATTRPGQAGFRFRVFQRYGLACAVCGLEVREVLQAAHIRPWELDGTDDERNGLVLCATHHLAFDAGLFAVHPETLVIDCSLSAPMDDALGITRDTVQHLRRKPHQDALRWHWSRWRSKR